MSNFESSAGSMGGIASGESVVTSFIFLLIGVLIISIIIARIFYILTLRKALLQCSIENRAMSPGLVWLLLIPIFNFIWNFIVVINIANSLHAEFKKRGITTDPYPGKNIGLAYSIMEALAIIPVLGLITEIPGIICWIVYWVTISNYSNRLLNKQELAIDVK